MTLPYTCSDEDENKKTTRAVKEIEDQKSTYESNVMTATKCNAQEANGALIGTAYVARDVKAIAESLGEDGMIRYLGMSSTGLLSIAWVNGFVRLLVWNFAWRDHRCHVPNEG